MKQRPLLFWIAMFMTGLICYDYISGTVLFTVLLFLCGILFGADKFLGCFSSHDRVIVFGMVFCFIFGFLFMKCNVWLKVSEFSESVDKRVSVCGVICEKPVEKNGYVEYKIKSASLNGNYVSIEFIVRCDKDYEFGDKVVFNGVLQLPKTIRNRGGFDYRKYLQTQNVWGIVRAEKSELIAKNEIFILERFGYLIREKCEEFVFGSIPEKEAGILQALLVGDDSFISDDVENYYKDSGMIHLLVVSGSHVAFFVLFFTYIFSVFDVDKRVMPFLLTVIIILYVFITGCSVSVLRAGIGSIFVLMSKFFGRKSDSLTSLFLVAFLILWCNPLTIFSLSFQLSFAGVFGILLCYPKFNMWFRRLPKFLGESLSLTLAAQSFVAPILVCQFYTFSFSGLFSNIFAVSLSGVIMMVGFTAFFMWFLIEPLGVLLNQVTYLMVLLMNLIAKFFGGLEFLNYTVTRPNAVLVILYCLCMFCVFTDFEISKKLLCYITAFVLVIEFCVNFFDCGLEINFIDVGHGDSIFIVLPDNRTVLIDTGGGYWIGDKEYNAGSDTVVPYLLARGYSHVDMIVITHFDEDHVGGLSEVLKDITTDVIAVSVHSVEKVRYSEILDLQREYGFVVKALGAGMSFSLGEVNFEVVSPFVERNGVDENNDSVCLMCEYDGIKVLFTGDLESEGERYLIEHGVALDADILKVAHHGSTTSTTAEFVEAVSPRISVISVGTRFKSLPGKDVLTRLVESGSEVYRTDLQGEVSVKIRNGSILTECCVDI